MILRFRVQNFRCFGDEFELSLLSPKFNTNVPKAGSSWSDVTERVAAIYGPNAAGKSTVIEAINALARALAKSSSGVLYQPSLANPGPTGATSYEVDFVADDIRYVYEVQVESWGIAYEALVSFPKGSRRELFTRTLESAEAEPDFKKGDSLTGPVQEVWRLTKPRALFLANALRYGHRTLRPVAQALLTKVGIDYVSFRDRQDQQVLLRVIMEMIAGADEQVDLVRALVRSADLGIERVEVRSEEVPEKVRNSVLRVLEVLKEGESIEEEEVPRIRDVLTFIHTGSDGTEFELPVSRESSGTITWLTTAWHALDALRRGSVLLIDELDASLHPELARYIVQLFKSEHSNVRGAQLIFTSHDPSLLGNAPTKLLEPRNVWFVEKDDHGSSELYSQAEFDNRNGNNTEKRYLAGQFGAVPEIDDRLLMEFVTDRGPQE